IAPPVVVNMTVPETRQPDVVVDLSSVAAAIDRMVDELRPAAPQPLSINTLIQPPVIEGAVNLVDGPDMRQLAEVVRLPRHRIVIRDEDGRITGLEEVPDGAQSQAQ